MSWIGLLEGLVIDHVGMLLLWEFAAVVVVAAALWLWVAVMPPTVVRVRRLHVRGARAVTLPGLILVTEDAWDDERVIRHELEHHTQLRRFSPFGVAAFLGCHYVVGSVRRRVRDGRWPSFASMWETNPLERAAVRAMETSGPLPRLRGWP